MRRFLLTVLVTTLVTGCGMVAGWQKRREARALESSIAVQQENLKRMSPEALEQAESDSREKAISQYEKILRDYSDIGQGELDESLYLLGKLLFEREQQDFQRGQQTFEQRRTEAEAAGQAAPEEPKPRYPQAKAVYERLLKEFPESPFREDALYDLGYIFFEEGDRKRGAELFQTLSKEKPAGRYTPEVNFRLAEYDFESNHLADAEERYQAVAKSGPEDLRDKALFKLGWVHYNLDRYDEAKRVLTQLLRREAARLEKEGREFAPAPILFFPGPRRAALHDLEEKERKGADLYQETLEIIARVYTDSGGADGLVAFLKSEQRGKTPPRYAAPLLHRLALVQKEKAQFEPAAHTYELLLATFPTFKDAPKIELELVDVVLELKDSERAAKTRAAMLDKYDIASPWARANPEEEVRVEALKNARKGLAWAIRYYHSKGLAQQKEKGGTPPELRQAITLYERYLKRFPEGKASYAKRFRYGQVLFAAGEYARAAETFRVVSEDVKHDTKREEAAFDRILAVEELAKAETPPKQTMIDQIVAAYEDYQKLNPASEKNAGLLFKEGNLYFTAANYPAAIAAFERLIREHPADKLAAESNDLIAQAHFKLGEYAVAEEWSEKALSAAGPDNPLGARRPEVEKLYALSMFKQGEKAEEGKNWRDASRDYLRLVDRLPKNEIAPRALYNAATSTGKGGQNEESAAMLERLLDSYPESDLAPDAAVRLAEFYQKLPDGNDRIMRVYENVADHHAEDPKGEEFLFLAGKLAAKDKKTPETLRLFEKFLSRYRSTSGDVRGERNVEALYHLGVTYAATGNAQGAKQRLEEFLSRPHSTKASFGEEAEGYAYATANAQLMLGKALLRDYRAVRIQPPVAESLKRKEALLAGVVERFTPAVASGISPLATEASFGIGTAYEDFGTALDEAPRPPGLRPEERLEYDRLLFDKIRPYLSKAVDAYRVTVRASREKGLADDWVGKCRERLAAVAPRVFVRSERPSYLRLPADPDPPPAILATLGGKTVAVGSGPGFFGKLVAKDSEVREGDFAKGLAAAGEDPPDWGDAYDSFSEAAKDGPPEAGYNAAVALVRLDRKPEAERQLDNLSRRFADFQPASFLLAKLHDQGGRMDAAASAYRRIVESPTATAEHRAAYASFLERRGKGEEALPLYEAVLGAEPTNQQALLGVARLSGTQDAAELEKLLQPLGSSPARLVELGILAAERGQPAVAARAFASARVAVPRSDRIQLAIVLVDEAQATLASGEIGRAEGLTTEARQADGTLPAVSNAAGMVRMRRGDFEGAEQELQSALKVQPSFGTPWANLGILNELYFGSPEKAVECYHRYLATRPTDAAMVEGWVREIQETTHGRRKAT